MIISTNAEQLILPFAHDEHTLKEQLQQLTGRPVSLIITDNTTSMLSIRKEAESVTVRLHKMFLYAGTDVCNEVAGFIKKGRCNNKLLRSFIRQNSSFLKQRSPVKVNLRVTGENYCLKTLFESLNSGYFDGKITSSITWGRSSNRKRVKLRTLGSYNAETNTIRINPQLDKKTIPIYFLEFVIYHEMLHAWLGIKKSNGRRSMHSKEFRLYEKRFMHYESAMEWEKRRFNVRHRTDNDKGYRQG